MPPCDLSAHAGGERVYSVQWDWRSRSCFGQHRKRTGHCSDARGMQELGVRSLFAVEINTESDAPTVAEFRILTTQNVFQPVRHALRPEAFAASEEGEPGEGVCVGMRRGGGAEGSAE